MFYTLLKGKNTNLFGLFRLGCLKFVREAPREKGIK